LCDFSADYKRETKIVSDVLTVMINLPDDKADVTARVSERIRDEQMARRISAKDLHARRPTCKCVQKKTAPFLLA